MSFIRGKNIIFGEIFVFETEMDTNVISENSIPIEQDATVFDDLHIFVEKMNDYMNNNLDVTNYIGISENLTNSMINTINNPEFVDLIEKMNDYMNNDVIITNI